MAISTKPVVFTKLDIQFITELTDCSIGLSTFFLGGGGIEVELLVRLYFYTHRELVTVDLTKLKQFQLFQNTGRNDRLNVL